MFKRDYNDPDYKRARDKVRKRDNYKCQYPGCCNKTRLQVHHIYRWVDQPHLRYDINTMITLCANCHKIVTKNEDAYAAIFLTVLAQNKAKKNGKK